MSHTSIKVSNISKQYRLGTGEPSYKSLRDSLANLLTAAFRRSSRSPSSDTIWALKGINFEVKKGQAIGVIGANGSGKSTLLKILSRITEPTEGRAEIHGRVGSLLEVGTGFHKELTGRENTYFNGALLGMKKKEIDKKFDEIVAFAEVEKFMDTPVKHYSTGMELRLAFAVAAHLETEILLVDEALSVGDAAFQKKCLGKMGEVTGQERTVLFVSHNMGAVKTLTDTCIWLDHGRLREMGPSSDVVDHYLSSFITEDFSGVYDSEHIRANRVGTRKCSGEILLKSLCLKKKDGSISGRFTENEEIFVELTIESKIDADALEVLFRVKTSEGQLIFTCFPGPQRKKISPGAYKVVIGFNPSSLVPGLYYGEVLILSRVLQDKINPCFFFEIVSSQKKELDTHLLGYSASSVAESFHSLIGIIHVESRWEDFNKIEGNPIHA